MARGDRLRVILGTVILWQSCLGWTAQANEGPCPAGATLSRGDVEVSKAAKLRGASGQAEWCEKGGVRVGPLREKYADGSTFRETWYANGQKSGPFKTFHRDGTLATSGQFEDDERVGTWRDFRNGVVIAEYRYEKRDEDVWIYQVNFHANGSKATVSSERNGKPEGTISTWYPSGQRESEGAFADGVQVGVWTSWHANGKLAKRGAFVEGKKEGVWETWSEDGEIASREDFGGK